MTTWGDLFSPRQALSLCHIVERVKCISTTYEDKQLGEAVQTCLALALDRCADKCGSVVVWDLAWQKVAHVFGRQALPMVWDFAEANILSEIGWTGACEWVLRVIEHNARSHLTPGSSTVVSATAILSPMTPQMPLLRILPTMRPSPTQTFRTFSIPGYREALARSTRNCSICH